MRVLHVATDIDSGSGRGSFELHRQLLELGVESRYFSAKYSARDGTMKQGRKVKLLGTVLPRIERILAKAYKTSNTKVIFSISPGWLHTDLTTTIKRFRPDVVHLHWVWHGMVSPAYARQISQMCPVVWTLRDANLLTGGCHCPGDCNRWQTSCGRCPLIDSTDPGDISHRQLEEKVRHLSGSTVTLLATSSRMHKLASQSRLSKLLHPGIIPVSINIDQFTPRNKPACREALGLAVERKYVLFSALDFTRQAHKGWSLIEQLLRDTGQNRDWDLILVGDDSAALKGRQGIVSYGRIADSRLLSIIYSAADATIMPSSEESFGKVAAESLATGTPVIASSGVGAIDFIEHGRTGWIFPPNDYNSALAGINHFLNMTPDSAITCSKECADTAIAFGASAAQGHIKLYEEIIARASRA
ncbi:MAG: glycosyltransferase [Candidatus Obscuribacterales bacterium]|nr:glycosyltransferase [Candidatus Obscuribacterales bacterium]